MRHLLDISTILAGIWQTHALHSKTDAWLTGKELATCPLTELGFLRISTNLKGPFRARTEDARWLLEDFITKRNCVFVAADLPALRSNAATSEMMTDCYLADLAEAHKMKLATLDSRIRHKAVEFIS